MEIKWGPTPRVRIELLLYHPALPSSAQGPHSSGNIYLILSYHILIILVVERAYILEEEEEEALFYCNLSWPFLFYAFREVQNFLFTLLGIHPPGPQKTKTPPPKKKNKKPPKENTCRYTILHVHELVIFPLTAAAAPEF